MTVAVSCNLSDGVILGVDSAVTVPAPGGVAKVYENAEKLFQLRDRPIGVAAYGLGGLGNRSIGSYLREFEVKDPGGVVSGQTDLAAIVEQLRQFFVGTYMSEIAPLLENETKKKFKDIPPDSVPLLGIVVGGFSHGAYLSEVWEIMIPLHDKPGSAIQRRPQGSFGTNWYAMFEPIRRYIKGFDANLMEEIKTLAEKWLKAPLTPGQAKDLRAIMDKYEYQIPYGAMPMDEGVAHTRFLVELVISHHRFSVGAPVVGGGVKIGKVTYRADNFDMLEMS